MESVNIVHARTRTYSLPLRQALPPLAGGARARQGWLLQLVTDDQHVDYGEIAPLPGLSRESPPEIHAQLDAVAELLPAVNPWPSTPLDVLTRVTRELPRTCAASVRFGVEMALLNVLAARRGSPWHHELDRPWHPTIAVNALVSGSEAEQRSAVQLAVDAGYTCLKLKVGHLSAPAAIKHVCEVGERAGSKVALRVDVNRAWALSDALAFAAGCRHCAIAYVEEPVENPEDLATFRKDSGLRVAVDESLVTPNPPPADVWIVKPTLRGGIAATLVLAARAAGVELVISSAFESGVGLRALCQLAALTHATETVAAGVGTGDWFVRDVLADPLAITHGVCHVDRDIRFPTRLREKGAP